MAPMEGITGRIFRNAYQTYYHNIDRYYTPFLAPNQNRNLSAREKREILPEHNTGMQVVPQILTKKSDAFIRTARELQNYGYDEVNLNLGCPSPTVVTKGKGAGFLANTEELNQFLEDIFCIHDMKISIKTRIGRDTSEEWENLLSIYNQYPTSELIIHPRTQKDFIPIHLI